MKDVELITTLSEQMDMSPQDVADSISVLFTIIEDNLIKGESIIINGLGQFEAKKKLERILVNPNNGKRYLIPPKLTPIYKPASQWKVFLKNLDENE